MHLVATAPSRWTIGAMMPDTPGIVAGRTLRRWEEHHSGKLDGDPFHDICHHGVLAGARMATGILMDRLNDTIQMAVHDGCPSAEWRAAMGQAVGLIEEFCGDLVEAQKLVDPHGDGD